jgi:hypothetical protein
LKPITTPIKVLFDFLNRPSRALAGAVLAGQRGEDALQAVKAGLTGAEKHTFEDVLGEAGVQPGLGRTVAGLGADIVTDPLNLLGVGAVKSAIGGAVRGVSKLSGLSKLGEAVKGTALVRDLGAKFIPHYGLPASLVKSRRLLGSEIDAARHQAVEDSLKLYKHTTPAQRETMTRAMEKGPLGNATLDPLLVEQKARFAAQAQKEVTAGVLEPGQVMDDYVTYLFRGPIAKDTGLDATKARELSGKNPFAQTRKLTSIDQALLLGAEPDLAKIAAVRQAAGDKAILVSNFVKSVAQNPEFAQLAGAAPEGWRALRIPLEGPVKAEIAKFHFAPEVANDLDRLTDVNKARSELLRMYDSATRVWKGYATTMRPAFHTRNLLSNVFQSWLGGMSPAMAGPRYAEALAWIAGKRASKIGKYTAPEIDSAMHRFGVVGLEFGGQGDIAASIENRLGYAAGSQVKRVAQSLNPASSQFALQRAGRATGLAIEDMSRRALFLDRLHKHDTLEEAALKVKNYLFDYNELTDFERNVLRRVFPFYAWIRKNLPMELIALVSEPQKFAHTGKVTNAVERMTEATGQRTPEGERPEFVQEMAGVQVPVGGPNRVYVNPGLPYVDLNKLPIPREGLGATAIKAATDLGTMLNPALRAAIELPMNKDLFTGRALYNETLGPNSLAKAPAWLAALAQKFPEQARMLGIVPHRTTQGTVIWAMPASAKYVAQNVAPSLQAVGKAAYSGVAGNENPMGGFNLFSPMSAVVQTPLDRVRDLHLMLERGKTRKRTLTKEQRRTLTPEQIQQLLNPDGR